MRAEHIALLVIGLVVAVLLAVRGLINQRRASRLIGPSTEPVNALEKLLEHAASETIATEAFHRELLKERLYAPMRLDASPDDPLLFAPADRVALCIVTQDAKGPLALENRQVIAAFTSPQRAVAFLEADPSRKRGIKLAMPTGRELLEFCVAKNLILALNMFAGVGGVLLPEVMRDILRLESKT